MSPEKTISPINNLKELLGNGRPESPGRESELRSGVRIEDVNRNSPSNGGKLESVSLQSFNAMLEKLSPRTESKVSVV